MTHEMTCQMTRKMTRKMTSEPFVFVHFSVLGEDCVCVNRKTVRRIVKTVNGLQLAKEAWKVGFLGKVKKRSERRVGEDHRHTALRVVTKPEFSSSSEDEEEEEEGPEHEENGQGVLGDDEEMEEGEVRGGTPETSRQVMEDDLGGLVVRRDLRQEAEEGEEERDSEEEAEIKNEDRGGDEDELFLFDESQLEFDEFNDSTRLSSELYVVVCFVIFIHTSTM